MDGNYLDSLIWYIDHYKTVFVNRGITDIAHYKAVVVNRGITGIIPTNPTNFVGLKRVLYT